MEIPGRNSVDPSLELLRWQLPLVCASLHPAQDSREVKALQALIYALSTHYPSVVKRHFRQPNVQAFFPQQLTGDLIKLQRIAAARLASYL